MEQSCHGDIAWLTDDPYSFLDQCGLNKGHRGLITLNAYLSNYMGPLSPSIRKQISILSALL
jgi:hypothetical protein